VVFEPQTRDRGKVRVLFLDDHASHITGELQYHAVQTNVKIIWILAHTSHLLQPLDQQPFATLKAEYAKALKWYDPTGSLPLGRAQFDILWKEARDIAFTEERIRSGWQRACLYPLNLTVMLSRRSVANHRPTTPDLVSPKTVEYSTPKRKQEWKPITQQLLRGLPVDRRPPMLRIEHHLDELEAETTLLRAEVGLHSKIAKAKEAEQSRMRLRKTTGKIVTNLKEVAELRVEGEDQTTTYIEENPSTFALM